MNSSKQAIYPERIRCVPARFSWIDQRLVQDHHLERLDVYAAALYLFLVTVANAQGLSWYSEAAIVKRLPIDQAQLRHARCVLVRSGLLAFADGVYQILPLDAPHGEFVLTIGSIRISAIANISSFASHSTIDSIQEHFNLP